MNAHSYVDITLAHIHTYADPGYIHVLNTKYRQIEHMPLGPLIWPDVGL